MNDDELGRFLRDEIPEAGAGYWEQIDARIAAAAAERPAPAVGVTNATQTDDNVVRLTDMNTHTESPNRTPWLLAAAAAFVLLAVGAFALTRTSDEPNDLDTVDTPDVAPDDTPSDPPAPGDGELQPDPDDDEVSDVSPGEESLWDGSFIDVGPPAVFVAGTEGEVEARLLPGDDQSPVFTVLATDVYRGTGNGAEIDGEQWIEVEGRDEVPMVWFRAAEVVPVADLLDPIEPAVVIFTADMVNLRLWPGTDADISGQVAIDTTLPRTGNRAVVDGREWIELDAGEERSFTWVAADLVAFIDGEGVEPSDALRNCYSDGFDLLFLDFAPDAETFTGGFAFLDSVEYVEGVRDQSAGSVFDVEITVLGSDEETGEPITFTERWLATADGLSLGDRAFLEPIDCGDEAERVAQLNDLVYFDI